MRSHRSSRNTVGHRPPVEPGDGAAPVFLSAERLLAAFTAAEGHIFGGTGVLPAISTALVIHWETLSILYSSLTSGKHWQKQIEHGRI
jgi:hypothetical protein